MPPETEPANQLIASYEQAFQAEVSGGEPIYGNADDWSAMTRAAHERRIELLDQLPIGDVSGKVCVDYGCGPWGFAAVYPRLHGCREAIGLDISPTAVKASERLTSIGNKPFGNNYRFLVSCGDEIDLASNSVDVFFSGESIEHVENTDAFLDEVHRVLKPEGLCVITTPNADAYLYRIRGDRYCVGPEHLALMSYDELLSYFHPRFELVRAVGFNGGVSSDVDDRIREPAFATAWARLFEQRPDLATGIILLGRRRDNYRAFRQRTTRYHHSNPAVRYNGNWQEMSLARAMTALCADGRDPNSSIELAFEGTGLIVHLWCHDWSGIAEVAVGGDVRTVNLYSRAGGFVRVVFQELAAGVSHSLTIRHKGKDPLSHSDQILFYQAVAVERVLN